MKTISIAVLGIIFLFAVSTASADGFYDEIQAYAEAELEVQAKPLVEAFGTGVCGGLYHTAKTHKPLGFDVGLRTMIVLIPSGKSDIFDDADLSLFPIPVLQGSVGLPMDFEVMLRGFGVKFEEESISLFGIGLKKNFNHLIPVPGLPDVSAMIAYHTFKASDMLSSSHISFDIMVSKKFIFITPYAGLGFDNTKMSFEYVYVDPNFPSVDVPIAQDIKASTTRFTLGLNLSPMPFVNIFADYNVGKFSEITAGLAIGIR
ncbi:hypothetical protein CEE37_11040 [candidate division LCP-89 bacterium B3_LCP]|uniref:Outer membrane protein beta-barrel domain-containing protein n=1 Tax=candidate division LCP-89 bacterium B3_LCP TaxID=2012998 RepID=A0A532UXX7_UNCL8|nr:MAG: hypothetical protein CEE37_11040 [candidate division LCP-89 bacterium B3_LCP]